MKMIIALSLLVSTQAFAFNFNKVQGSFEGHEKKTHGKVQKTREPASMDDKSKKMKE